MKKNTTHNLTVAAMLSAVAFILMFIEFPLPMLIPSFVKMDFSDLPALLGAFALGPVYGVVISFMKNLLHIIIKGTSTACVGELCNFMLGAVFYRKDKPKSALLQPKTATGRTDAICLPFLASGLYRWSRSCTGSAPLRVVADFTASGESHPALKRTFWHRMGGP